MYVCYVDESGHCGKKYNSVQPVEVLCGVVSDATKLFKTQRELAVIVKFLNKRGIPLTELKASDAYRGRRHWSGVDPRVRDKIFEFMLKWAKDRSCKFIVCPIDSKTFFDLKAGGCATSRMLCHPYEAGALNVILSIQRNQSGRKNNKGKTLVIFDEQAGHDLNTLKLLENDLSFTDGYTGYKPKPRAKNQEPRLNEIIDVPHFSKSHLAVLIQLSDWLAFIVNTYLLLKVYGHPEKYAGELAKIEKWYGEIGKNLVTHTNIDPPGKNPLCQYYRSLRPSGWSAKAWVV